MRMAGTMMIPIANPSKHVNPTAPRYRAKATPGHMNAMVVPITHRRTSIAARGKTHIVVVTMGNPSMDVVAVGGVIMMWMVPMAASAQASASSCHWLRDLRSTNMMTATDARRSQGRRMPFKSCVIIFLACRSVEKLFDARCEPNRL